MVILRFFFIFTLLITLDIWAKYPKVVCTPEKVCEDIQVKVEALEQSEISDQAFLERVYAIALDHSVRLFQVYVYDKEIVFLIEKKAIISSISMIAPVGIDVDALQRISQLQEGVFYNEAEVEAAEDKIIVWLEERGYQNINVDLSEKGQNSGHVTLKFKISYGSKVILRNVKIKGEYNDFANGLFRSIRRRRGQVYSRVKMKVEVDKLVSVLKNMGYFNAKIDFHESKINRNERNLELDVHQGFRTQFSFNGNSHFASDELLINIKRALLDGTSTLNGLKIKKIIEKSYLDSGLYNTEVSFYKRTGMSVNKNKVRTLFFSIKEGKKIRLKSLSFKGNLLLNISILKKIFYDNASTLSSRDFLDESYLKSFSTILKDYYLQRGFVLIDVSRPRVVLNKKLNSADVTYSIKERQQSILSQINLNGIPEVQKPKVLAVLRNQLNHPLNVVELEKDLGRALSVLRGLGYYYAKVRNLDGNNVVTYDMNFTRSQINIEFNLGKITRFENLVLSGNRKTKDIVLTREVNLVRGEVITPRKLKNIQDKINGLGLFARVQVIPIVTNKLTGDKYNKTNVIIHVREKKFGRGIIAPGFRTDIGAKLSLLLTKGNLFGLNDAATLKLQVNQRFNISAFDQRRRTENKHRPEGLANLSYTFPYLFNLVDFSGNFSIQRRRFYSFDADIIRIAPQFSKQFNRYFGANLKYQYEKIRQFDATQDKDKSTFQIGSLTPGITLDFRDTQIAPRSGAFFSLTWELANPSFGSQKNEKIEIDFSKVISRNRFYIPVVNKSFVLAFSVSMGMEKNYAQSKTVLSDGSVQSLGYIPSVKVFRLDGFDMVRGFSDIEINRLSSGHDITKERISGAAYFANFKFEPRFYTKDNFVIGPFFDAGKLFVNTFKPLSLRTSAGLTFKFLTPVGTLNFDYGVKLHRGTLAGTKGKEQFGRFHISIGYF